MISPEAAITSKYILIEMVIIVPITGQNQVTANENVKKVMNVRLSCHY